MLTEGVILKWRDFKDMNINRRGVLLVNIVVVVRVDCAFL